MRKRVHLLTRDLERYADASWGEAGLDDFRFPHPEKPGPKTVKSKLAGVEKRRKK